MESKPFHICPFCQSARPASQPRCVRCHRSLAGLPLPVYGSEIDATVVRSAPPPLVDLPLHGEPALTDGASRAGGPVPPVVERRRIGRGAKIAIAAAMMGAVLIGGWLARAQDGRRASEHAPRPAEATLPTAAPMPAMTAGTLSATAPRVRPTEAARRVARPAAAVAPRAVYTVHPDVGGAPVGVARARDDLRRDRAIGVSSEAALGEADLRSRLRGAERRRDEVAAGVDLLRARTNVPVIKDVERYQRLQEELSAALDELDRADAEVARLRRTLAGRE